MHALALALLLSTSAGSSVSYDSTAIHSLSSTANVTLYVDVVNGKDGQAGTSGAPLKTIGAALAKFPLIVKHALVVNVAAGTYPETLNITNTIASGASLTIQGSSWAAYAPATSADAGAGVQSGTFDSTSANTLVLSTAAWVAHDLKGKFVHISSGAKSGTYYPIADNTTTAIEVTVAGSTIGNAAFDLVVPAAKLTKATGESRSLRILAPATHKLALFIKNLWVSSGSSYDATVLDPSSVDFVNCLLDGASTTTITSKSSAGNVTLQNCAISGAPVSCTSLIIDTTVISATGTSGIDLGDPGEGLTMTNSIIQGSTGPCIYIDYGVAGPPVWIQTTTLRSCNSGLKVDKGLLASASFSALTISSCTLHGIWVTATGRVALDVASSTISGMGGDAVRIEGSHSSVSLSGTTALTSNTGWGVNLGAGGQLSAFNQIKVGSSASMSSNTAGDLTLDGTTASTLAALRAVTGPPAKVIVDANRFSRLAGD